jgi:hypothetical protein
MARRANEEVRTPNIDGSIEKLMRLTASGRSAK